MSETESSTSSTITESSESSDDNPHVEHLELEHKLLNKYNIISKLGQGADAIVWLAYNIEDSKFYAIKVNEPNEYKKGTNEFNFIKGLPNKMDNFNHLKESFTEIKDRKKYACGVFELHTGNLDSIIRKGKYKSGLPINIVKNIMKQLLTALMYLHQKKKIYHADIKTDNILLKGINDYDIKIVEQYKEKNFYEKYTEAKKQYWIAKGKSLDKIDNMKPEEKIKVRQLVHKTICEELEFPEKELRYCVKDDFVNNCKISLSDFGAWCGDEEYYDTAFGTRYYRAPEVILVGESSTPVDIWAAGCVLYEMVTGKFLFDPDKDSKRSRDDYHLYNISQICGEYSIGFLKSTENWKDFFDSKAKLRNFSSVEPITFETLLKERGIEPDEKLIDLLKGMLTINPKHRFTAEKCLKHPFLT